MANIAILGAGMGGFGAAYHLQSEGIRSTTYEKLAYYGGHTASTRYDNGFIFDEGPHISFTKIERMQKILAENVNEEYEIIQARVNNYWQGYWIKHPAQCNLHGLPEDLVVTIIKEFFEAQTKEPGEIHNYAQWLEASYGPTFAKTFPSQYGKKYHTTTPDNMSTDWVAPRLYRPDLDEVLRGALSPNTADVHYISHFRYPTHGGFVSYLKPLPELTDLRVKHELIKLDPKAKTLSFANGVITSYDGVISSIPLPELIPLIEGVPSDVVAASQQLSCSICIVVNISLNREDISDWHWTYFYDDDFCFSRLNFPHMLSPNNVPPGTGSIQAEIYFSKKYKPVDRPVEEYIAVTISDLRRCGLIREDDEILFTSAMYIPYANVIFDLDRAEALKTVHGYLDDVGVAYCGRYGEWAYIWTDESFISGERAAQRILQMNLV
jgi:protoporphyrinogen oxidase